MTITYRDVIINHALRDNGPTLAQIRAAVQQVVDQEVTQSTWELQEAIESQLDRLDRITADMRELRQQITQLGASSDNNAAVIAEKLARIAALIERGQMEEARWRLDDLHLTRPGRSVSLRVFATTNLGGSARSRERSSVATTLQSGRNMSVRARCPSAWACRTGSAPRAGATRHLPPLTPSSRQSSSRHATWPPWAQRHSRCGGPDR